MYKTFIALIKTTGHILYLEAVFSSFSSSASLSRDLSICDDLMKCAQENALPQFADKVYTFAWRQSQNNNEPLPLSIVEAMLRVTILYGSYKRAKNVYQEALKQPFLHNDSKRNQFYIDIVFVQSCEEAGLLGEAVQHCCQTISLEENNALPSKAECEMAICCLKRLGLFKQAKEYEEMLPRLRQERQSQQQLSVQQDAAPSAAARNAATARQSLSVTHAQVTAFKKATIEEKYQKAQNALNEAIQNENATASLFIAFFEKARKRVPSNNLTKEIEDKMQEASKLRCVNYRLYLACANALYADKGKAGKVIDEAIEAGFFHTDLIVLGIEVAAFFEKGGLAKIFQIFDKVVTQQDVQNEAIFDAVDRAIAVMDQPVLPSTYLQQRQQHLILKKGNGNDNGQDDLFILQTRILAGNIKLTLTTKRLLEETLAHLTKSQDNTHHQLELVQELATSGDRAFKRGAEALWKRLAFNPHQGKEVWLALFELRKLNPLMSIQPITKDNILDFVHAIPTLLAEESVDIEFAQFVSKTLAAMYGEDFAFHLMDTEDEVVPIKEFSNRLMQALAVFRPFQNYFIENYKSLSDKDLAFTISYFVLFVRHAGDIPCKPMIAEYLLQRRGVDKLDPDIVYGVLSAAIDLVNPSLICPLLKWGGASLTKEHLEELLPRLKQFSPSPSQSEIFQLAFSHWMTHVDAPIAEARISSYQHLVENRSMQKALIACWEKTLSKLPRDSITSYEDQFSRCFDRLENCLGKLRGDVDRPTQEVFEHLQKVASTSFPHSEKLKNKLLSMQRQYHQIVSSYQVTGLASTCHTFIVKVQKGNKPATREARRENIRLLCNTISAIPLDKRPGDFLSTLKDWVQEQRKECGEKLKEFVNDPDNRSRFVRENIELQEVAELMQQHCLQLPYLLWATGHLMPSQELIKNACECAEKCMPTPNGNSIQQYTKAVEEFFIYAFTLKDKCPDAISLATETLATTSRPFLITLQNLAGRTLPSLIEACILAQNDNDTFTLHSLHVLANAWEDAYKNKTAADKNKNVTIMLALLKYAALHDDRVLFSDIHPHYEEYLRSQQKTLPMAAAIAQNIQAMRTDEQKAFFGGQIVLSYLSAWPLELEFNSTLEPVNSHIVKILQTMIAQFKQPNLKEEKQRQLWEVFIGLAYFFPVYKHAISASEISETSIGTAIETVIENANVSHVDYLLKIYIEAGKYIRKEIVYRNNAILKYFTKLVEKMSAQKSLEKSFVELFKAKEYGSLLVRLSHAYISVFLAENVEKSFHLANVCLWTKVLFGSKFLSNEPPTINNSTHYQSLVSSMKEVLSKDLSFVLKKDKENDKFFCQWWNAFLLCIEMPPMPAQSQEAAEIATIRDGVFDTLIKAKKPFVLQIFHFLFQDSATDRIHPDSTTSTAASCNLPEWYRSPKISYREKIFLACLHSALSLPPSGKLKTAFQHLGLPVNIYEFLRSIYGKAPDIFQNKEWAALWLLAIDLLIEEGVHKGALEAIQYIEQKAFAKEGVMLTWESPEEASALEKTFASSFALQELPLVEIMTIKLFYVLKAVREIVDAPFRERVRIQAQKSQQKSQQKPQPKPTEEDTFRAIKALNIGRDLAALEKWIDNHIALCRFQKNPFNYAINSFYTQFVPNMLKNSGYNLTQRSAETQRRKEK